MDIPINLSGPVPSVIAEPLPRPKRKPPATFLLLQDDQVHGWRETQTIDCHSIQAAIKFIHTTQAQSRLRKWINERLRIPGQSSRAVILGPHPHSELPEPGQQRHVLLLAISSSARDPGCSLSCHQTTRRYEFGVPLHGCSPHSISSRPSHRRDSPRHHFLCLISTTRYLLAWLATSWKPLSLLVVSPST